MPERFPIESHGSMELSYSPSGENDEGGWFQRFWRNVSPSRDQNKARSADGQDKEGMFRERATYTAHGEDNHGKAQAGNKHAKAGSEDEGEGEDEDKGKKQTDHKEERQDRRPKQGIYMDEDENNDKANVRGYNDNKNYRGPSTRTEDRDHDTDMDEIMAFITRAEKASHEELIEHLDEANFNEKTKEVIMDRRVDGASWMMLWNMDNAKSFINTELRVDIIQEATYRGHI